MTEIANQQPSNKYKLFWNRLLASIIDAILLLGPLMVITSNAAFFNNYTLILFVSLIYPFCQIAYSVLCHYYYGQTLGKSITKIKVLDVSEIKPISFKQAIYRDSIWIVIEIAGLMVYLFQRNDLFTDTIFPIFLSNLAGSFTTYWLILELISMMTNKKRRAIHDFIARTVVVRAE